MRPEHFVTSPTEMARASNARAIDEAVTGCQSDPRKVNGRPDTPAACWRE
jgi:hypothetical protein